MVWLFGLVFGFALQRARFCFASSFRDLFLFSDGRVMKAVLAGMAVAVPGFALVMFTLGPNIVPGRFPTGANVMPLGIHTLIAGFLFAVGMTLAGGCISGSLYRVGEGYVGSLVALLGMLFGFWALGFTWNFWWAAAVSWAPRVWFPHSLGWVGGAALALSLLAAAYLAVLWWESRAGPRPAWQGPPESAPQTDSFWGQLRGVLRTAFVKGWPVALGGVFLGLFNILYFLYNHPVGVTSPIYQWMSGVTGLLGLAPGELKGVGELGGACVVGEDGGAGFRPGHDSMLNFGLILGSFIAASIAGEFRLRVPRQPRRYVQALAGGALMGYGAGLAMGCTLGAFFSSIPSLGINGWGFGLGLLGGASLGVKLIRRIG
jgi:uncharacterized membrane protein YedE/YeeE